MGDPYVYVCGKRVVTPKVLSRTSIMTGEYCVCVSNRTVVTKLSLLVLIRFTGSFSWPIYIVPYRYFTLLRYFYLLPNDIHEETFLEIFYINSLIFFPYSFFYTFFRTSYMIYVVVNTFLSHFYFHTITRRTIFLWDLFVCYLIFTNRSVLAPTTVPVSLDSALLWKEP